MNDWQTAGGDRMRPILDAHVAVSIDGSNTNNKANEDFGWNSDLSAWGWPSDDINLVGTLLVNAMIAFNNTLDSVKIYAASNGASMTNRIAIQNRDSRITHIAFDCSQLSELQFRNGVFYQYDLTGTRTTAYATPVAQPPIPRHILIITGGGDGQIPQQGGASQVEDIEGNKIVYHSWHASALAWATAFGYAGSALDYEVDDGTSQQVHYAAQNVRSTMFAAGGHIFGTSNRVKSVMIAFFTS